MQMTEKEWAPGNILDVFGDSVARAILVLADQQTMSAKEIADRLDVSTQTVYRRVNELVDSDLLREHRRLGEGVNHHIEYETVMDEVTFAIDDNGYTVDVTVNQDLSDDFDQLWSDMEDSEAHSGDEHGSADDLYRRDPA